ncbi:hypothetical protein F5877DRAFT_80606 [Lentinula edodes]|nr:hypothetical protein F5877DRAFT_80606 [Lentinula edodes]
MEDVSLGIEDLPYDLAGEIFRHLPSSADLLHIAQASKSLYYVAIRILYRDIHYETLSDFYHNLPFWTHNVPQNIAQVPRSILIGRELGQSFCQNPHGLALPRSPRAILALSGVDGSKSEESFPPAFLPLRELLLSFPKLQRLTFRQARLTHEIHSFLGELPATIRSLAFEQCSFISKPILSSRSAPTTFTQLPVKELCITGTHTGRYQPLGNVLHNLPVNLLIPPVAGSTNALNERLVQLDMYHILTRSPKIQALCLDWNITCAGRFSRHPGLPPPAFSCLDHLEVRHGMRSHAVWNGEANSTENKLLLMSAFAKLLAPCNSLTELVLFGYIPGLGDNGTAKPILPALMSYTGPTDFLKSSLRHCEMLQKLIFPDAIKDIDTVMLEALPYNARESVRFLDITVGHWDIEVLYAISMELPRLEVLKIKYEVGYPDQDMLISFGPEFFSRIPHLTIFHLYRPEIEYDELRCLGVHSHLSKFVVPSSQARKSVKPKLKLPSKSRAPSPRGSGPAVADHPNTDTDSDSDFTVGSTTSASNSMVSSTASISTSASSINSNQSITTGSASAGQSSSTGTVGSVPDISQGPSIVTANSVAGTSQSSGIGTVTGTAYTSQGPVSTTANSAAGLHATVYHTVHPIHHPHHIGPQYTTGHRWRCICQNRPLPKIPVPDLGPCGQPDAHEYMASWEKYAPGLREVRLVDAFVWRRAGVGDEWCRRDLKDPIDEEEQELGNDGYCRCNPDVDDESFV